MPNKTIDEVCALLGAYPEARAAAVQGQSYVTLLPLLEYPLPEVQAQLPAGLTKAGLSPEEAVCISPERLVLFALTASWGSHWPELAVSWLESGLPISPAIAHALNALSQDKRFPQSVRHRGFALAKRWARSKGSRA